MQGSESAPAAISDPVDVAQLRQVADELDQTAENPPCSEAGVIRDAAAEIEKLDALVFYYASRGWPAYTERDRQQLSALPEWDAQSRAVARHLQRPVVPSKP